MSRGFAQAVDLTNPGEPVRDDDDTTDLPGPPHTERVQADIWALDVQQQVVDGDVVVADYTGLFPPGTPVTSESQVRDVATATLFTVYGRPEPRRSLRTGLPDHIEARLKFISDQQGDPS